MTNTSVGRSGCNDEEILDQIRQVSDNGVAPSSREFDEAENTVSVSTIQSRFGSYNNAVREAGLEPWSEKTTEEDVIEQLQHISENGVAPGIQEFNDHHHTASQQVIYTHFDGYPEAVKAAGLTREGGYTKDEIIGHLQRVGENNTQPTQTDIKQDDDAPSIGCVKNMFGGWEKAISEAGFNNKNL